MRSSIRPRHAVLAIMAAATLTGVALAADPAPPPASTAPVFSAPTRIDNRYLPLTRFRRCELRGTTDDGTRERSVKTLLSTRKRFTVDGAAVDAVTIRDNAYEDGRLVESTLDYYAQADDSTVYYLGEQVKNLHNGKVVNTKGTWLYGRDTDRLGVAMPAAPQLGQQWRFEDVPGTTVESDRVEEVGLRAKVQGRIVGDVIRIQEFLQPEGDVEMKTYAPGLGVIDEYPPDGHITFAGCRR